MRRQISFLNRHLSKYFLAVRFGAVHSDSSHSILSQQTGSLEIFFQFPVGIKHFIMSYLYLDSVCIWKYTKFKKYVLIEYLE